MTSNILITESKKRLRRIRISLIALTILVLVFLYVSHASQPGSRVEGCPQGCAAGSERVEGGLRVVSLNMLHGFPWFRDLQGRVDVIGRELQRLDPDVVLLQEVPWTVRTGNVAEHLAGLLGYNYVYYRANGNKNLILFEQGEAILSRYPLTDVPYIEYSSRASFFDTRIALGANAATPWGEVGLFVTHLTNEDLAVAGMQAEQLRKFVQQHSSGGAVVAGDFNSPENSPQIITLAQAWTDSYRVVHPGEAGYTCCVDELHSEAATPMDKRIDYIFIAQQGDKVWKIITSTKVFDHPFSGAGGWQWASDHEGLMVEIEP